MAMETTGRSLVLMRNGAEAMQAGVRALQDAAGLTAVRSADPPRRVQKRRGPPSALCCSMRSEWRVNGDPDQPSVA